jgi:hypothetical protein
MAETAAAPVSSSLAIDPSINPAWIWVSDGFMTLCFVAPALSLSVWWLQRAYARYQAGEPICGADADVESGPKPTPAELAARSGGSSEQQRAADQQEEQRLKDEALARAKA